MRNRNWLTAVAAMQVVCVCSSAFGQTLVEGGTAVQNLRGATARAPSNMVTAGIGRASAAVRPITATPVITEPAPAADGVRDLFVPNVVTILAQQINDIIFFFTNLLFERAGLPALTPIVTPPPTTGGMTAPDPGGTTPPDTTPPPDDGGRRGGRR